MKKINFIVCIFSHFWACRRLNFGTDYDNDSETTENQKTKN